MYLKNPEMLSGALTTTMFQPSSHKAKYAKWVSIVRMITKKIQPGRKLQNTLKFTKKIQPRR